MLETERIDAVFTDLNMPVMSGSELLREMATGPGTHPACGGVDRRLHCAA